VLLGVLGMCSNNSSSHANSDGSDLKGPTLRTTSNTYITHPNKEHRSYDEPVHAGGSISKPVPSTRDLQEDPPAHRRAPFPSNATEYL